MSKREVFIRGGLTVMTGLEEGEQPGIRYQFLKPFGEVCMERTGPDIVFKEGSNDPSTIHGVTEEALLAIVIDRLTLRNNVDDYELLYHLRLAKGLM